MAPHSLFRQIVDRKLQMNSKTGSGSASTASQGLAVADKQISALFSKFLPQIPYYLHIDRNPYKPEFVHENLSTPFEACEVPTLQYMTLSPESRGLAIPKGDWQDEIYGSPSDAGQSNTSTPNPARDKKRSQKMSFGDYKNYKQTGVKPPPKPDSAMQDYKAKEGDVGSTNTKPTGAISVDMSSVSPFEGGDNKQNGASATANSGKQGREHDINSQPRSTHPETKDLEKSRPFTNGLSQHDSTQHKDSHKDQPQKITHPLPAKPPIKHLLPPRPQSPPRSHPEHKQKRSFETNDISRPEKRVKTQGEPGPLLSFNGSQKVTPHKHESATTDTKLPQSKAANSTTGPHSSTPTNKVSPTKPAETKTQPKKTSSNKPLDLPALLSPLPEDLVTEDSGFSTTKKHESEKSTPSKTGRGIGSDTIVVKQPPLKATMPTSSPKSGPSKLPPPPFVLPRLLSPDLPDIVEAELLRLQQKHSLNSVEARHENARRPDAPGVARKTTKAKVGHPPKKSQPEFSSNSSAAHVEKDEKHLIVKIPYKKRQARDIARILGLTQKPRGQREKVEGDNTHARDSPFTASSSNKNTYSSDSDEDVPLAKDRGFKAPVVAATASSSARKRPSTISDNREPAAKRAKGLEGIDTAKISKTLGPAFKSPAPSAPGTSKEKDLLSTPKKGDTLKSVIMRKVDSNDGQARTPQPPKTSTPASTEKSRFNSEQPPNHDVVEEARLFALGTSLKRKMQNMINPENLDKLQESEATEARKLACCSGIEGQLAYMLAFQARGRIAQKKNIPVDPRVWEDFTGLFGFVGSNTRYYPELAALCDQLCALGREQLNRIYLENLKDFKNVSEKCVGDIRENSKKRDSLWQSAARSEHVLKELGVEKTLLGPWSSIHQAVGMGLAVLDKYSARERLSRSSDQLGENGKPFHGHGSRG